MPLKAYDRFFGGKPGSAEKAMRGMKRQYGRKKGTEVFYRLLNDRRKAGKGEGMRGVLRDKSRSSR